jgi:hypothetical protein
MRRVTGRNAHQRRGTTSVELALVSPVVFLVIFGCIEMGFLMRDLAVLKHGAADAARMATVGHGASEITQRVNECCSVLNTDYLEGSCEYRAYYEESGEWGSWQPFFGGTPASGDQLRVTLVYQHDLLTGSLFRGLAGGGTALSLQVTACTCKE